MYSSYSVAVAVCSVIFSILAPLAVLLWFRACKIQGLSLGADDWAIGVALAGRLEDWVLVCSNDPHIASPSVSVFSRSIHSVGLGLARICPRCLLPRFATIRRFVRRQA